MAATKLILTTGVVYARNFSGTLVGGAFSGDSLTLDAANLDTALTRAAAGIFSVTTGMDFAAAGVRLTGANGVLTLLGKGTGADESLLIDLNTTANSVILSSGTSANIVNFSEMVPTGTRAGIATTSTDGVVLQNTTASTDVVPVQQSPRLRFRSNVWNTTVTAANNTDDWWIESVPVSGATPSSLLKFGSSLNGAATTYGIQFTNLGSIKFGSLSGAENGPSIQNNGDGLLFVAGTTSGVRGNNATNSTELWQVTNTGNWGLKTNAPAHTLDVNGAIGLAATSTSAGVIFVSSTAPTIASGFGTTPSVVASNGTAAFTVNVGTGGTATAGVITMPAATTGWIANVKNLTALLGNAADVHTVQIASSTTSITVENQTISTGAAVAWAASDILQISAMGY